VGTHITDILNSIPQSGGTNPLNPHAMFVSQGPADYYMLNIPLNVGPAVIAVYYVRTQKWFIWQPSDVPMASLFFIDANGNPRWLFTSQAGPIYEWVTSVTAAGANKFQDRINNTPFPYSVSIQTSWMDFGDPNLRKGINQLLYTGASTPLRVSLSGAITDADLNSPTTIFFQVPTVIGPLQDNFVPIAGFATQHRWYQLTLFDQLSTNDRVLDRFSFEVIPIFRY
jgi:hypothetical protein